MKIATIKRNKLEKYFLATFMIFVLGVLPILYLYYTTILYRTWMEWFSNCAIIIPFFIIFLCSIVFFIIMIFKKPKKYTAILLDKKTNKDGNLALFFEVKGYKDRYMFCLVEKDNNFRVSETYLLTIKEAFEMILFIEENNNEENEATTFEKVINHKDFTLNWGIIAVGFVLLSMIVLCIIGIVLFPEYSFVYIGITALLNITLYRVYLLYLSKK